MDELNADDGILESVSELAIVFAYTGVWAFTGGTIMVRFYVVFLPAHITCLGGGSLVLFTGVGSYSYNAFTLQSSSLSVTVFCFCFSQSCCSVATFFTAGSVSTRRIGFIFPSFYNPMKSAFPCRAKMMPIPHMDNYSGQRVANQNVAPRTVPSPSTESSLTCFRRWLACALSRTTLTNSQRKFCLLYRLPGINIDTSQPC